MFDAPTLGIIPSTRAARVHLFRHGEVETGPLRICRGQADVPLSPRGREQSQAVAGRFLDHHGPPDRGLSSDLSRCTYLAAQFGLETELVPGLREQDMGRWEGRTWDDLTQADGPAVTAYWNNYVHGRPTGGETWGEAAARVVATWQSLLPLEGRVVIVSHVGPIRALLCHWLGLDAGEALRFAPAYATETRVIEADAGVVIEAMGLE